MPSNGSAVISGFAILENPRAPDIKKPKTLMFDARFYAEGEQEDTIFAALRYFNGPPPPTPAIVFPRSCICYIKATVSIKILLLYYH